MSDRVRRSVAPGESRDRGRGIVRLDPDDLIALGVELGDTVAVVGPRTAAGRVLPTLPAYRGRSVVQLDAVLRENTGVALEDTVELRATSVRAAQSVALQPLGTAPRRRDLPRIGRMLDGVAISADDRVEVAIFGTQPARFRVSRTEPVGPVLIAAHTELRIDKTVVEDNKAPSAAPSAGAPAFEDIGGLGDQLSRIREIIELPLRHPELFARLGVEPPKGVLLHGPSGCGKTLIARTLARESGASFHAVSGPEIIHKHYGESEARLRQVFSAASQSAPAIVFLDEIDALAPRRDTVQGEVEKRVVATLLTLMDGLERRTGVVVIGATNLPDALDPALRRPGRFDRELAIPVPDVAGRLEILHVHSRAMPLAEDVDLAAVAAHCHGYVGADLEALCREAAMARLRAELDADGRVGDLDALFVHQEDFWGAMREVAPSALREVVVEVPQTTWADIGGLERVKTQLQEVVTWPLIYADHFRAAKLRPPRGVLLHGPPGCGKTLIARAVAHAAEASFLAVDGPELLSRYVGESSRAVRELFARARRAAPCVLFFDELDGLARARGSGGDDPTGERVLTQLLAELDGVEPLEGVLVLAATNRIDRIDAALLRPGRFDELIEVGPPDAQGASEILATHLRGRPLAPDLDPVVLGRDMAGLTGARIAGVVRRAALMAVRRTVREAVPVQIQRNDLARASAEERRAAGLAGEAGAVATPDTHALRSPPGE